MQTISKEACSEQLLKLADSSFTGQIFIRYQETGYWTLHLSLGWIFYATSSSTEKWHRKFLLHCPQLKENELLGEFLNYSIESSFQEWEYHFLFSLMSAKKITKSQAAHIAFVSIAEALSEIMSAALSGVEFNEIDESLSDPPTKSFNAASIISEIRGVEHIWQIARTTGSSFDSALIVKQPAEWRKNLSAPVVQQKIAELVDGRHTLWDLAVIVEKPATEILKVLIPQILSGVLGLVDVNNCPLAATQIQVPMLSEDISSSKPDKVKQLGLKQTSRDKHQNNRRYLRRNLISISIVILSLLSMGCYLFWKIGVTKQSPLAAAVVSNVPSTQSDIQSSNSMHDVLNVPKGLFSYGGSLSFAPLRSQAVINLMNQAQSQFELRYVEPVYGSGDHKGVSMLLKNELSFSQNAMPLTISEYNEAKSRGFKLQEVPVGIDADVFFIHPGLNIPGLSVDQLQLIYTGRVTNWNQLGGPDLPITPITIDPKDSSAIEMLMSNLPNGVSAVRGVKVVRDHTATIRLTSAIPGAIGYGSISTVRGQQTIKPLALAKSRSALELNQYISPYTAQGQINVLAIKTGTYPLTHNIFVDIRRDGTANEKAGVAYANLLLTYEGQNLVETAGFTPVR